MSDTKQSKKRKKYIVPIVILGLLLVAGVVVWAAVYNLHQRERYDGPSVITHAYGDRLKEKDALKEGEILGGNTREIVVLARKVYSNKEETHVEDECQYDRFGNVIQRTWYDADGNIRYWGECYYNNYGYLRWLNWYNSSGRLGDCYEYRYDEAGNEIHSAYYIHGNDYYSWTDREFDESGHLLKEISYDVRGAEFAGWDEYEYDSLGRLVKKISCDESGEPQYQHEYAYDDYGNPVQDTSYDYWTGTLLETIVWEYAYDGEGRLIRETCLGTDDWYDREYGYDDDGRLLWEVHYKPDGSEDYRYDYEYMTITVQTRSETSADQ